MSLTLASNPNTPPTTLEALAADANGYVRRAVAGNRTDLARPQVERDESRVDVADYKRQIADARAILGATDSEMLSDAARRVMDRLAETLIDFDHDRPSPSNDTDR